MKNYNPSVTVRSIGVGTGGGGGGGGGMGEEVDRSTPSTGLIRDVPGGSALSS